jgi:cytidyltransferase-like protein
MGRRVIVSGYFSAFHVGHLELFQLAKKYAGDGGELVVVVNNDHQAVLKKGKQFMPAVETATILRSIRYVDDVYISIDKDRTVRETIQMVHEIKPLDAFINGGDAFSDSIPEAEVCKRLGIEIVDGFGAKIQSSSALTGLIAFEKR